jgi:hypothetical protein
VVDAVRQQAMVNMVSDPATNTPPFGVLEAVDCPARAWR